MEKSMKEASPKSSQATSRDTSSVISSVASQAGPKPCGVPELPQTDLFGQVLAPVSPSVAPAQARASKIHAIYGRTSFGSSESADLSESLGSRLQTLSGMVGSTVYRQIWRRKTTPLGRRYWEHTARGQITSGSDCTGWRSPTGSDGEGGAMDILWAMQNKACPKLKLRDQSLLTGRPSPKTTDCGDKAGKNATINEAGRVVRPSGQDFSMALSNAAQLSGWPTPNCDDPNNATRDSGQFQSLTRAAQMASWGTPRVTTNGGNGNPDRSADGRARLEDQAQGVAGWCSPASRDFKDSMGMSETGTNPDGSERSRLDQLPRQAALVSGAAPSQSRAGTESRAALNPAFSRWLMGFCVAWDTAAILAYRNM